jgi:hypothetical protein
MSVGQCKIEVLESRKETPMHVIQQIAITAESAEAAADTVKHKFDEMYSESEGLGGWSDWYVVGGGRWNSDSSNQYKDSHNDVLSYDNSPNSFLELIDKSLACRTSEMEYIQAHIKIDTFTNLIDKFVSGSFEDEDRFDMNSYYIKKAADLINGTWNSDSYFYDLDNYSTTPKYMLESIDKGNKNWYLVPVDFHF